MSKRKETTEELLRYTFTPEEKQVLSDKLALACQEKYTAEEEKKSAMAGFKKRIDEEAANMNHFSRLVNNGWEMRPTECRIDYNTPVHGTKRIIRIDTGELVREIVMTAGEYQDTLLFVDPHAEDKLAEKTRLADLERTMREFFAKPSEVESSLEPVDVSEITSWRSGELFIAAATEEAANTYATEHGLPLSEPIVWADPDASFFEGFDALYGDENRSCRAGIMKLFELGRPFPCLLCFPLSIVPTTVAEEAGEALLGDEAVEGAGDGPAIDWTRDEPVVMAAYGGDLDAIAADGWGDRSWEDNRANNPKVIEFEKANKPEPAAEAATDAPADPAAPRTRKKRTPKAPTTDGGETIN